MTTALNIIERRSRRPVRGGDWSLTERSSCQRRRKGQICAPGKSPEDVKASCPASSSQRLKGCLFSPASLSLYLQPQNLLFSCSTPSSSLCVFIIHYKPSFPPIHEPVHIMLRGLGLHFSPADQGILLHSAFDATDSGKRTALSTRHSVVTAPNSLSPHSLSESRVCGIGFHNRRGLR